MVSQFDAMQSAIRGTGVAWLSHLAGAAVISVMLAGCTRTMPALVGADPADPNVRVASTGYRSTTAPYRSLRPANLLFRRKPGDRTAPANRSERS